MPVTQAEIHSKLKNSMQPPFLQIFKWSWEFLCTHLDDTPKNKPKGPTTDLRGKRGGNCPLQEVFLSPSIVANSPWHDTSFCKNWPDSHTCILIHPGHHRITVGFWCSVQVFDTSHKATSSKVTEISLETPPWILYHSGSQKEAPPKFIDPNPAHLGRKNIQLAFAVWHPWLIKKGPPSIHAGGEWAEGEKCGV